jgi:hypothetical protein
MTRKSTERAYYSSSATTAFIVDEVAATSQPTQAPATMAEQYFIPSVIGIIAAIAIVGAAIVVLLRKR